MKNSWFLEKKVLGVLVLILFLGVGIRLYNLGYNSFVADEFLDINSSYGFAETGVWQSWDFNFEKPATENLNQARDERAVVYKWQVAQVLKVFGATEGTARLVSVFWGVIAILLVYCVTRYLTKSKETALIAAFLFAVSISSLIFSRRLRMYAMFLPVYLALSVSLYALLESEYKGKVRVLKNTWERFGVNIVWLLPTLLLGALSYFTHQLTISIIPMFGVYILVMALVSYRRGSTKNKYSVLLGIGLLGMLLFLALGLWSKVNHFFYFFDNHYSYFGYILNDFAHPLLGLLLIILGSVVLIRESKTEKAGIWLTLSLVVPLAMAVWLWNRNAGAQYIFFIQSFVLILAAAGINALRLLVQEHFTEWKHAGLGVILLALLLVPNYGYFLEENNTYHETSSGGNPNYRKVFGYFMKEREAGEVLITRNFRNFYFRGAEVEVFDFGGELSERNFQLADFRAIQAEHPQGWIIVSDNDLDYFSKEMKAELTNLEQVSNSQVRGAIEVYRWPGPKTISVTTDIHAAKMKMRNYEEYTKDNIIYPGSYEEPFTTFLRDGADIHIALGDNTNTCGDAEYAEKLAALTVANNAPTLFGFGNHDCDEGFQFLSDEKYYIRDTEGVRIIVLNTDEIKNNETGQDDGGISDTQLGWLEDQLQTKKKVVIAMSKPAFRKDLTTPKPGYEKFFSLVKNSSRVEHIFGGDYHIHNTVKEYAEYPGIKWHFVPALTLDKSFGAYHQITL